VIFDFQEEYFFVEDEVINSHTFSRSKEGSSPPLMSTFMCVYVVTNSRLGGPSEGKINHMASPICGDLI
jgi:hypothetical protein